mmetsp:Transcript_31094/g.93209  ORF Transcript_31094/g.93209 Transcript_31094/m.93209 type:complete len:99 (+) Transcript_31094:192-488(+)
MHRFHAVLVATFVARAAGQSHLQRLETAKRKGAKIPAWALRRARLEQEKLDAAAVVRDKEPAAGRDPEPSRRVPFVAQSGHASAGRGAAAGEAWMVLR